MELEIKIVVSLVGKGLTDSKRGWEGSPAYDKILFYDLGADYLGMFTLKNSSSCVLWFVYFSPRTLCLYKVYPKKENKNVVICVCLNMDCSSPGSSVHGTFQARILEWVAISFSMGSSPPRDRNQHLYVSCTDRRVLYH